jgi:hypothetical protein
MIVFIFSKPSLSTNGLIFSQIILFKKIKACVWGHYALFVCAYPTINLRMAEQIFIKFGVHIMTPEPISTAYFINPSHWSVFVFVLTLLGNG